MNADVSKATVFGASGDLNVMKAAFVPGGVVGALLEQVSAVPAFYCRFNLETTTEDGAKVISACLMRESFHRSPSPSLPMFMGDELMKSSSREALGKDCPILI